MTKAADRGVDDSRVEFPQHRVVEAQFFHRVSGEVLDDDIGLQYQLLEQSLALAMAKIDRDILFAAIDVGVGGVDFTAIGRSDQ